MHLHRRRTETIFETVFKFNKRHKSIFSRIFNEALQEPGFPVNCCDYLFFRQ